jgi:hypothetical protein
MESADAMFTQDEAYLDSWSTFDLATASDGMLDFIGTVIGIPRPIVTQGNYFRFGYAIYRPTKDGDTGFGSLYEAGGGVLDSTGSVVIEGTKVDDGTYRAFLRAVSPLRKSLSLSNLDSMAYALSGNNRVTLSFDANGDISMLIASAVSSSTVDLIQQVCDYFFATSPQVFCTREPVSSDELSAWYSAIDGCSGASLDEIGRTVGIHRPVLGTSIIDSSFRAVLKSGLGIRKDSEVNATARTYAIALIESLTSASKTVTVTDTTVTVVFAGGTSSDVIVLVRDLLTFFFTTRTTTVS